MRSLINKLTGLIIHFMVMIFILTPALSFAGNTDSSITGQVIDSVNKRPVPFATVILYGEDHHQPLQTGIADSLGRFGWWHVKPGNYNILASYMGYSSPLFKVTVDEQPDATQMLHILLTLPGRYLDEITVTGKKPLYDVQPDRIIYRLSNDPYARNKSLSEAIKKTPLVTVDHSGTLSLRGSNKVTVQINGKSIADYAIPANQALNMIPASYVDHIEVLTTPSVASDADAVAGIINIVTKNDLPLRTNIILGTEATIGKNYVINPSLGVLYGGRKINLALNGNYNYFGTPGNVRNELRTASYLQSQDGSLKYKGQPYNINASLQYELNKKNNIRAGWVYNRNGYTFDQVLTSSLQEQEKTDAFDRASANTYREKSHSFTLDYKRQLHKPGQELSVSGFFNSNKKQQELAAVNVFSQWETAGRTLTESGRNISPNRTFILQSDLKTPVGRHWFTAGIKMTWRKFNSDFTNTLLQDSAGREPYTTLQGNSYSYRQYIAAGYAQFRLNLPKKYILVAGVRYELTANDVLFNTTKTTANNHYNYFIPGITAARMFGNSTIALSYSKAVNRPGISYLNPYVSYTGYNNYAKGNPGLQPEISNKFLLSYQYNGNAVYLYADMAADFWKHYILSVNQQMDNGAILTTYKNVGTFREWGPSVSLNWSVTPALSLNINAAAKQVFTKDTLLSSMYNDKISANASAVISYYPAEDWEIQAEYNCYTPVYRFQTRVFTGNTSAISAARTILKGKGRISLGILNPLNAKVRYESLNVNNSLSSRISQELNARAVTIGFRITFGNENVKKKGNAGINDTGIKESLASPIVN